ncbi:deoxyribodipyrimidine photo-lyase [Arthrobacter sp. NPDC093139]
MASTIDWLRDDLRLDDNPALSAAASRPDRMTGLHPG